MRQLHIGPGSDKLPGFETLDITPGCDFQMDISKPLAFPDQTFDLIYMSHVIEHLPWYKTVEVLRELRRILVVGGRLEVWTVDALKVAWALIEAEETPGMAPKDGWKRFNRQRNPFLWCAGRLFAYEKNGNPAYWHKALFTSKHLKACFEEAGFNAYALDRSRVRGKDHGYVNLGVCGIRET